MPEHVQQYRTSPEPGRNPSDVQASLAYPVATASRTWNPAPAAAPYRQSLVSPAITPDSGRRPTMPSPAPPLFPAHPVYGPGGATVWPQQSQNQHRPVSSIGSEITVNRILLMGLVLAAFCLLIFVVVWMVIKLANSTTNPAKWPLRFIDPENVDFGSSYWDQFCNWTFRPESAVQKQQDRSFIMHGSPVVPGSYQYLAFLLTIINKVNTSLCTASVLDNRHLLTAAHCLTGKDRKWMSSDGSDFIGKSVVRRISLGMAREGQTRQPLEASAEAIYIHPDFDKVGDGLVDIAVIRTQADIPFDDYVRPVCLASASDHLPKTCAALGYGRTEKGKNRELVLFRAPSLDVFSSKECREGSLRGHIEKLFYDLYAQTNPMTSVSALQKRASLMVDLYFRGKVCSLLSPSNNQSVCSGDSGGPLMCTPVGTWRSPDYQDQASPLFQATDPSLKQFGISMALVKGKNCGEKGLTTMFTSVKYYRLWLEYVVLPMLKDSKASQEKEQQRMSSCPSRTDWSDVTRQISSKETLSWSLRLNICRKLHAYLTCVENSPRVEFCDHMDVTIVRGLGKLLENLDLLPMFKKERCRQLMVC